MVITLLARFVLARLRKVDPKTLAAMKIALGSFNARRKVWQESATPISSDVVQ